MPLHRPWRRIWRYTRIIALPLLTPLFEKNPCKTMTISRCQVPMVLSMSRLIVLAFAVAMLYQLTHAGIAGWPDATLCITIVLALPLLSALDRVGPEHAIAFMKALIQRFGVGAVRSIAGIYPVEPSKFDDHRDDDAGDEPVDVASETPGSSLRLRKVA